MGSADKETIFIRGPMGPRGERGPAGIDGVQGVDGADGAPGVVISVPSSGWSWVNQGGATISTNVSKDVGSLYLKAPIVGGDSFRLRVRSLPAGKQVIAAVRPFVQPGAAIAEPQAGILWRESSSGKFAAVSFLRNYSLPSDVGIWLPKYNNETTYSGGRYTRPDYEKPMPMGVYWLKLKDDGANRIFSMSVDGENWHMHHSIGRTDFLTADQFGFFVNSAGMEVGIQILSWEES